MESIQKNLLNKLNETSMSTISRISSIYIINWIEGEEPAPNILYWENPEDIVYYIADTLLSSKDKKGQDYILKIGLCDKVSKWWNTITTNETFCALNAYQAINTLMEYLKKFNLSFKRDIWDKLYKTLDDTYLLAKKRVIYDNKILWSFSKIFTCKALSIENIIVEEEK